MNTVEVTATWLHLLPLFAFLVITIGLSLLFYDGPDCQCDRENCDCDRTT